MVKRMREGHIEEMHSPRNPLDVLAQQTVAAVAAAEVAPVTVRGVQQYARLIFVFLNFFNFFFLEMGVHHVV